ncbi:MAG: hypothetical protein ACOC35_05295, partial [Promethearchaeia archaeon]
FGCPLGGMGVVLMGGAEKISCVAPQLCGIRDFFCSDNLRLPPWGYGGDINKWSEIKKKPLCRLRNKGLFFKSRDNLPPWGGSEGGDSIRPPKKQGEFCKKRLLFWGAYAIKIWDLEASHNAHFAMLPAKKRKKL